MNIISAAPQLKTTTLVRPSSSAVTLSETAAETKPTDAPKDTFKSTVTKAAYAGGGAVGGLALGAVSGQVMTHLTGNPVFSTVGGLVGAVGGAATTVGLALTDQPVHMGRVFGSWAGSSAGATGGMYAMQSLGKYLGEYGAATYFPTHGALIGAVGAGLAGAGIAFAGDESKIGTAVRATAKGATGALIGMAAGGGVQALLATHAPQIVQLSGPVPFVLGGALGLLGVQNDINPGWVDNFEYGGKKRSEKLDVATKSVLGGAGAYLGSTAIAGIAISAGASPLYGVIAPALGAMVGAAGAYGATRSNKLLKDLAVAGAAAGGTAIVGDAIGHGLSALTGMPVFKMAGSSLGALTGGSFALDSQGRVNKYVAPTTLGFAVGSTAGTLLGAGLTALTGHTAYQIAGSALGSVAGVLGGLALAANNK